MKTTPAFDRYRPLMTRSFALRAFNDCETEINKHFWSFKVISEYSSFIARREAKTDPNKRTAVIFNATGPDAVRIPTTVSNWLGARDELENWLRLSALVSAASYLELYLGQISRSALMSDPLRRYGAPRSLDGVSLLKAGKELPYTSEIEELTKGEWGSRLAALNRHFAGEPAVDSFISDLERIRKLRNNFAHGFGRAIGIAAPSEVKVESAQRLTQKTFLKYLAVISKFAAALDRFFMREVVGNFELLHFYHQWKLQPRHPSDTSYRIERAFQRTLNRELVITVNIKFCEELINFYDGQ